jgi:dTDP-4-amino-4,6-dideoxygalactose transaminase
MKVPLLDLKAQYDSIKTEILKAISEVLDKQKFILDENVKKLEERMAKYIGVKSAIAVASGSDALLLSLWALDIGSGDLVITTPFTFFATAGSIVRLGAKPLFVDIDPKTFNIDSKAIFNLIEQFCYFDGKYLKLKKSNDTIKAIIPVHLFGQSVDMDPIIEISNRFNIAVIEDAAQAIGAEYKNRRVGSYGNTAAFSFFPSKNLGCYGDGGIITTNNAELAEKIRILRVHGAKEKYYHEMVGMNSRLDEIQAAILLVKFDHLEKWHKERQDKAKYYNRLFQESGLSEYFIEVPKVAEYSTRHVYHQYTILVDPRYRNPLLVYLRENGVGCGVYYPLPLHLQKCFTYLGYKKGDFPNAEEVSQKCISLPIYPELTKSQQEYVVDTIHKFFKQKGK